MRWVNLIGLLVALGCAGPTPFQPQRPSDRLGVWAPEPRATLLRTPASRLENPTLTVVSDPVTWQALWTEAWGGAAAAPALPSIDFVLASVVVVGSGKRAGPGYAVVIDSIVVRTVGSVLYATESQPGAHCDAAAGASSPVHMVQSPGHPPIIEWRVSVARQDCPAPAP